MMIALLYFIAAVSQDAASKPCLGVAVKSQYGPMNLMGFTAKGSRTSIDQLVTATKEIGAESREVGNTTGEVEISVLFVSPPVKSNNAVKLIERARSGEFGPLKVETRAMGIETLPANMCPEN